MRHLDHQLFNFAFSIVTLVKVWGISTIHFYAGEVASGRSLPKSQQEEDDPLQMGGDFTLSRWTINRRNFEFILENFADDDLLHILNFNFVLALICSNQTPTFQDRPPSSLSPKLKPKGPSKPRANTFSRQRKFEGEIIE